jgi:hypothetical protein
MTHNEGNTDRIVRSVAGIGLGVIAIEAAPLGIPVVGQIILAIAAIILLLTGIVGLCPLYSLFGVNTMPRHPH